MLTVIVEHSVVERVDTLEVVRIQQVLGADPMGRFGAEVGLQQLQNWPENRQARYAEIAALRFQPVGQQRIKQSVEDDPRRGLDFDQYSLKLFLRPHQRKDDARPPRRSRIELLPPEQP